MVSLSYVVFLEDGESAGEVGEGLLDGKRVGVGRCFWSGENSSDEGDVSAVGLLDEVFNFPSGDVGCRHSVIPAQAGIQISA